MLQALTRAANMVRNTIIDEIQRGEKTGREYKRGDKTHRASAHGEYPATDTGNLISNIYVRVTDTVAYVFSRAKYSSDLEYGTRKMEPRPFMKPSLAKHVDDIKMLTKKAISEMIRERNK
jgi:hypothetical protein